MKAIGQKHNRLNEFNAETIALNVEYEFIEQKLKNMTLEIDNIEKKIQRLKTSKDKKVTMLA